MPDLQLFIHPKSKPSKAAQRFFKERGLSFHTVDVRKKAPSPGELKKWVTRFGVDAVLDKNSKPYIQDGLRYFQAGPDDWIERMCKTPELINLPLVRCQKELSIGNNPDDWQKFVEILKG